MSADSRSGLRLIRRAVLAMLLLSVILLAWGQSRGWWSWDQFGLVQAPPITGVDPLREELTAAEIEAADISVFMIGNSHTAPIPELLEQLFQSQQPDQNLLVRAPLVTGFLESHAVDPTTTGQLQRGRWDVVILQAQKYSTSGQFEYPIDGALKLAGLAQAQGSRVVMYPEWSRRGHPKEYLRIEAIHREIADQTGATVAPIGHAWVELQQRYPELDLYAIDGNHASPAGSLLNACVLYRAITGRPLALERPPVSLPEGTQWSDWVDAVETAFRVAAPDDA